MGVSKHFRQQNKNGLILLQTDFNSLTVKILKDDSYIFQCEIEVHYLGVLYLKIADANS